MTERLKSFPDGAVIKSPLANAGDVFDPWAGKIPWRKKWHPTPIFVPEKFHGQSSLADYSPWGRKVSDTTEQLSTYTQGRVPEGKRISPHTHGSAVRL